MIKNIDGPYHAARFVSLIPVFKNTRPGGEKVEIWKRFTSILAAVFINNIKMNNFITYI